MQRLVKEEASYHKELTGQEKRLEKLLASTEKDENREYSLMQEVCCSVSLEAVLWNVRRVWWDAWSEMESQLSRGSLLELGR